MELNIRQLTVPEGPGAKEPVEWINVDRGREKKIF
jgi:hypothetical protein